MEILYVVNIFPKLSETFILDQITYLIDRGISVHILARYRQTNLKSEERDKLLQENIEKYALLDKSIFCSDWVSNDEEDFQWDEILSRIPINTNCIVAHFADMPTRLAMTIGKSMGIPFVFFAHAREIFANPKLDKISKCAKKANKIFVPTQYNRDYLISNIGNWVAPKIDIIPCGINLKKFQRKLSVNSPHMHPLKILSVGRFVEKKGFLDSISAFFLLKERVPNVVLKIIGDGPLKEAIEQKIKALSLEDSVKVTSSLQHTAIRDEMETADIFLLPSIRASNGDCEGLPVAILEASAMELPIVSTLHTGIPEGVINGETGFLVHEKDIQSIADRLEILAKDRNLRIQLGTNGRKHIQRNYDMEHVMNKLFFELEKNSLIN